MGYIYATAAMIAFTVLGLTYKVCDQLACDKRQVNVFYYASAAAITVLWTICTPTPAHASTALWLGAVTGLIVFICILTFREAAARGPISISWTVLSLSLVVPIILSIFIWHEIPSPRHSLGLILTVVAIVLLGIDSGKAKK